MSAFNLGFDCGIRSIGQPNGTDRHLREDVRIQSMRIRAKIQRFPKLCQIFHPKGLFSFFLIIGPNNTVFYNRTYNDYKPLKLSPIHFARYRILLIIFVKEDKLFLYLLTAEYFTCGKIFFKA